MKVTTYETARDGNTLTVIAGPIVDSDLQGGLEEILWREIADGVVNLRVALGGMKFLHAGVTSCLLAVQRHLSALGGDVVLIDTPSFVRMMFRRWGVEKRFLYTTSKQSGPLYFASRTEAVAAAERVRRQIERLGSDVLRFIG